MPRPRFADVDLTRAVRDLAWEGFSPTQIRRELEQRLDFADRRLPSLSTITRIANNYTRKDRSGDWSVLEAEPNEALAVLDVLADVVARSKGRLWLSRDLASAIATVRAASPTIPAQMAYVLGQIYLARASQPEDNKDLDLFLACRPWESRDAKKRFESLMSDSEVNLGLKGGDWTFWLPMLTTHLGIEDNP